MDGEEGGGIRLSKRFSDKGESGEVDYKTKSGTAWSHSYLNQKPWHPLSYPNQRRKWIAEQTNSQREKRAEEVSREYAQEQEFFRQTALVSQKEKEKLEIMKAVSFMYVRPPGYNAESAKAAEIADDMKRQEGDNHPSQDLPKDGSAMERPPESSVGREAGEKKKQRPKDVFGRALPTEEEFEVLKNAPRMDTGVYARVKPFGVEVRNVKCVTCGIFGHQSGDRECPLKDAIMPNEENRLKRDDPLTTILAHADLNEPLKWELKQKPGISPPRGGFNPDDPNQQIVAEDIFDEYGGFLSGGIVPELLSNFPSKPKKKKSMRESSRKKFQSSPRRKAKDLEGEERISKKKNKCKKKKQISTASTSESDRHERRRRHKASHSSDNSDTEMHHRDKKSKSKHSYSSDASDLERPHRRQNCSESSSSGMSAADRHDVGRRHKHYRSHKKPESGLEHRSKGRNNNQSYSSEDSDFERRRRSDKSRPKHSYSARSHHRESRHSNSRMRHNGSYSFDDSETNRHHRSKSRKHYYSSEDFDQEGHHRGKKRRH